VTELERAARRLIETLQPLPGPKMREHLEPEWLATVHAAEK